MSMLVSIVKTIIRFQFRGWTKGPVERQRKRLGAANKLDKTPSTVVCHMVDIEGIHGEWIESVHADATIILYLHGGAYSVGSVADSRALIARIAIAAHARVLAVDYRLAPENPYPAALEDVVHAYRWLSRQLTDSVKLFFAGDSAGGGLALAASIRLRDSGFRQPDGVVCLSPWVDLTLSGASMITKAPLDPLLDSDGLRRFAASYCGGYSCSEPLISPLFAHLQGLPPLLIQVGSDEILLDDALRLAFASQDAGVEVSLQVYNGMFHVFQVVEFLPESKTALENIAEFIHRC